MSENKQRPLGTIVSVSLAVLAAVAYGIVARLVFGDRRGELGTLSLSFLAIAPLVLGFLAVVLAPEAQKKSVWYVILAPWAPTAITALITGLFTLEFFFCIVVALPLMLAEASLGGAIGWIVWRVVRGMRGPMAGAILIVGLAPYLVASVESLTPGDEVLRTVHSSIDITAPADGVWAQITDLDPIAPDEYPASIFSTLGLPRPVEARLACEVPGCVRRGVWEDGLAFDGIITRIEPGRSFWVRLEADTSAAASPWVPLAAIGGPNFGMVDDGYEIETLPNGSVRLHLYSTYRVRTGINGYAALWLDFLLHDIQRQILRIEKMRSEEARWSY